MRVAALTLVISATVWSCGPGEPPPEGDGPTAGCVDGDVSEQRHGSACLCCHTGEFSVAGSVDREGPAIARVVVTDRLGQSVDVVPNAFGNFFRHRKLKPPLYPVVFGPDGRALAMQGPAPSGDCNSCHREGGSASMLRGPLESPGK